MEKEHKYRTSAIAALSLLAVFLFIFCTTALPDDSMSLNSPVNEYNTTNTTPEFNFSSSGNNETYSCTLYINETAYGTNMTVLNNTNTTITANYSLADGKYTWYVNCSNGTTQNQSAIRNITIDASPPTTTASAIIDSGSQYTFNTWTNSSDVNVTLNCSDGPGLGCDKTLYCLDSADSCTPNASYSAPINVSTLNISYIRYLSNDTLGNPESVKSKTIKIDTVAPVTTASAVKNDSSIYSFGDWTNSSYANVTLLCNDTMSGCDKTLYCLDSVDSCTPNVTYSAPVHVTTVNVSYIRYLSNDSASNSETVQSETIKIDPVAPVTAATGSNDLGLYSFGSWTASDHVNVTLSCGDALSGCDKTLYCLDSVDSCTPNVTYSAPVHVTTVNVSYIRYLSNDSASNSETVQSETIKIDPVAPVTAASAVNDDDSVYSFGGWTASSYVNVTLSCDDTMSGCDKTLYCTDSVGSCTPNLTYSVPVHISSQGITYIRYQSNDSASATETTSPPSTILIDSAGPVISYPSMNYSMLYVNESVKLNVTISDIYTNVSLVRFFIEPFGYLNATNESNEYYVICNATNPCNTTVHGTYNWMQIWANDSLNNVASNTSVSLNYTVTAPCSMSISSVNVNEPDMFYSAYAGNDVINLRVNLSTSGDCTPDIDANFTNVSVCGGAPVVDLSYNSGTGLYNGSCNVSAEASGRQFVPGVVTIFAFDGITPKNATALSGIILYNMTTPAAGACMQWGSSTTSLVSVTDFSHVNLVLQPKINLSCEMGGYAPPGLEWFSQYETLALINFTSVDLSTADKAAKLANLPNNMVLNITAPNSFGDSRIYFNTSYFEELDTTTSIMLYHLPFTSKPAIQLEAGAAGYNGASVNWSQGAGEGNLSFTVYGFSGYDIGDNVTPQISITAPVNGSALSNGNFWINAALNGTGTNISSASFYINGSLVGSYVSGGANSANCSNTGYDGFFCSFNISRPSGSYNLTAIASDYGSSSGNLNSASVYFMIDTAAPVTTANAVNNLGSSYSFSTWTPSDYVNVTLSCNDTMSGCNKTLYCLDSVNSCTPNIAYSALIHVTTTTLNVSYIRYKSNDTAGNPETIQNKTLMIDTVAPVTTATAVNNDNSSYSFSLWTPSPYVNVTLNCDDGSGSACDRIRYCTDSNNSCNPTTAYTTTLHISIEGTSYIRYSSNDTVNNTEATKNKTIKIDTTAPVTSATAIDSGGSSYNFGTWTTSSYVNVTLSPSDGSGSGYNVTQYCLDSSNSCVPDTAYSVPVQVSTEGVSYIRYSSNDTVNNVESTKNQTIKIDTAAPSIAGASENSSSLYVNESVRLNVSISDTGSGVSVVKIYVEPFGNLTATNAGGMYYVICNATNQCNTTHIGIYNWTQIWANDTVNNIRSNTSVSLSYIVATTTTTATTTTSGGGGATTTSTTTTSTTSTTTTSTSTTTASSTTTTTPQNPPMIYDVEAVSITETSAVIKWRSTLASSGTLEYGLNDSYGMTAYDPSVNVNHSVQLTGLAENTLYHCRARSVVNANLSGVSGDYTFRTSYVYVSNQTEMTANQTTTITVPQANVTLDIMTDENIFNGSITVSSTSSSPVGASLSVPALNKYLKIETDSSINDSLKSIMLKMYYTDDEVAAAGLNESSLAMYWYNTSDSDWVKLTTAIDWVYGTGVHTRLNYVWANVSHFSYYSVGGASVSCQLKGDKPPCNTVGVGEILELIVQWANGNASVNDVLNLIVAWARGGQY